MNTRVAFILSAFFLLLPFSGPSAAPVQAGAAQTPQKLAFHDDGQLFILEDDGTLWKTAGLPSEGARFVTAKPVRKNVKAVAAAGNLFIIDKDNILWGWGKRNRGTLFMNEYALQDIPENRPIRILTDVRTVVPDSFVVFALRNDNTLWAWGNAEDLRGDNLPGVLNRPRRLLDQVHTLINSGCHALALKKDGSLWTWGSNACGGLGDGTFLDRYRPAAIDPNHFGGKRIISLTAFKNENLVLTEDGTLWYWGKEMDMRGWCINLPVYEPRPLSKEGTGKNDLPSFTLPRGADISVLHYEDDTLYSLDTRHILYQSNPEPAEIARHVASFAAYNSRLALLKTDGSVWLEAAEDHLHPAAGRRFLPVVFLRANTTAREAPVPGSK